MKKLSVYILILFLFACKAPLNTIGKLTGGKEETPTFANQGEQEEYWAKNLFRFQYKKQKYTKYKGSIKLIDSSTIQYGFKYIKLSDSAPENRSILTEGLFNPDLLGEERFNINHMEELTFLSNSPQVKRFRFLLWRNHLHNPTVCFIELTNKKAATKTNSEEFIKGAKLTYFKEAWTQI